MPLALFASRWFVVGTLAVLACFAAVAPAVAREWWVHLAPEEARQLYRSPAFGLLKAEADNLYLRGVQTSRTCLSTGSEWVQQMADAQEVLSAVYAALKWGRYDGRGGAELAPYRERIAAHWRDVLSAGPLDLWSDDFDGIFRRKQPSNCDPGRPFKPGWYEGDIALRFWIFGALPSYDAVRDDLKADDRQAIDAWMRGLAGRLWSGRDFALSHNRGVSASAQAHVIALVLQDRGLFEGYYDDPAAGLRDFYRRLSAPPKPGCSLASLPGLSEELSHRDAAHGNQTVIHGFSALALTAHAVRYGAPARWDPLRPADPARLQAVLDTWLSFAGPERDRFLAYARCLEAGSAKPLFRPSGLNLRLWAPLAHFDRRFLGVEVREGGARALLWQQRAALFARSGPSGLQPPQADR
jgi:hypothetical protein